MPSSRPMSTDQPTSIFAIDARWNRWSVGPVVDTLPSGATNAAATEMVAGRVQATFITAAEVQPFLKDARVRILGVSSARGSPFVPGVPTIAESGLPGFSYESWWGLLAPAATPRAVVDKLNAELVRILALPDVKERLGAEAYELPADTPDQFAALIKSDMARFASIVKAANIKLEN